MKAVVVHGPGDLRVDERPEPAPGPGQVLIAVEWGGICGSDLSYWRHGASGPAVLKQPLILGHEIAGRIAATGSGVTGFAAGLPVTVHPARAADVPLPERLAGRTNLHREVRYLGSAACDPHTDGGFAEYVVVAADQVRPLPPGVSVQHGALAEPLAVALHAIHRAGGVRGREVLVNGAGPIGLLLVAAAKRLGATRVVSTDIASTALGIAKALGADETRNLADGESLPADAELVFEASGVPAALAGVLRSAARGGTVVQVGNLPGVPAPAALGELVSREISWIGSFRFIDEITDALVLLGDGLDLTPVISHTFELDQAAEALTAASEPGSSKVMIRLSAAS
jgi:L-idonate 5-dehydrogenase